VKVYLAGPINGATDEEANGWRTEVKAFLPDVLDPMDRDYRGVEDANTRAIVEGDKADIDACDAVIAYCPKPSVGTSMEVLYAWGSKYGRHKPCVVVVPEGSPISPWLRYHATEVVTGVGEAVRVLLELPVSRLCQEKHVGHEDDLR
jgi:nucleoside 2-deoxyribosyltransferase